MGVAGYIEFTDETRNFVACKLDCGKYAVIEYLNPTNRNIYDRRIWKYAAIL